MTRKDYRLIASAVMETRMDDETRNNLATRLAVRLADTNPNFDHREFKRSCGVAVKGEL